MLSNWLSVLQSRKVKKGLAAAVTAGILAGIHAPFALAAGEIQTHKWQIIEDNMAGIKHRQYWNDQGVRQDPKQYDFNTDLRLETVAGSGNNAGLHGMNNQSAAIMWGGDDDGAINMHGHRLELYSEMGWYHDNASMASGLYVSSGRLDMKETGGIGIEVLEENGQGIVVTGDKSQGASDFGPGDSRLYIDNDFDLKKLEENAVDIKFLAGGGTSVRVDGNSSGIAELHVDGLMNIGFRWGGRGIFTSTGGKAYIGGGSFINDGSDFIFVSYGDNASTTTVMEDGNPLTNSGIYINANYTGGKLTVDDRSDKVVVNGNIDAGINGQVAVFFNDDKSTFKGVAKDSGDGNIAIGLAKGSVWTHAMVGNIEGFDGSHLKVFQGGESADKAGYILQKDSNRLTIDNYNGNAVVIYGHDGKGTETTDYFAGDTVIKSAASGSGIILSTDNTGVNMTDDQEVKTVLNALAGKIVYEGAIGGKEANLNGKVQIADGLTSSSAAIKTGDIDFNAETGRGSSGLQNKFNFNTAITGDKAVDTEYTDSRVIQSDGSYLMVQNTNINISQASTSGAAKAIDGSANNINILAAGKELALNLTGASTDSVGASAEGHKLEISANNVKANITKANGSAAGWAKGINASGENGVVALHGNLQTGIGITGTDKAAGIYVANGGKAIIDGNANLAVKTSADTATDVYGIYTNDNGSSVAVKGSLDIETNGTGIKAEAGSVDIAGAAKIAVNEAAANEQYALLAQDGRISLKAENGAVAAVKGNVGVKGSGEVNMKLAGRDSGLTGVIYNASTGTGGVNMTLTDGAVWTNRVYGTAANDFAGSTVSSLTGGSDAAHRGVILQKDAKDLSIKKYSGNALVIYEHTGDGTNAGNYSAGDIKIASAAAGSGILLSTDSTGITMSNMDKVNAALDTLAGKLYYLGYIGGKESNLNGKVQIADGLTASSASKAIGNIKFNDGTGKGSLDKVDIPEHQTNVDFSSAITGNKKTDVEYLHSGVIKEDGRYVFEKESNINIAAAKGSAVNVKNDVVIDATGSTLNLNVDGKDSIGLRKNVKAAGKKTDIKADRLNIDVRSKGRGEGVHLDGLSDKPVTEVNLNGDVHVKVKNEGDYTLGAYVQGNSVLNINGNVVMKGDNDSWGIDNGMDKEILEYGHYQISGLYAGSNYGTGGTKQTGGIINVNGNVDLAVNGTGVLANGAGSTININGGGTILTNNDTVNEHYAIAAESATVNMNMNKDKSHAGDSRVVLSGNIGVLNGALHENEPVKDSIVNLGLSTNDSIWKGVAVNNYTAEQLAEGKAELNLHMSKGAQWINQVYGTVADEFAGSKVASLTGGRTAGEAGIIHQKDNHKLTIDNYSGNMVVFYDHKGDGTENANYGAGDTIIKHAAESSGIVVSTDSSGIDLSDNNKVIKVLNALAGKLTYEGFIGGKENNLAAEVGIAEGLTSSSYYKKAEIAFDKETGKGGYNKPAEQVKVDFDSAITNSTSDFAYVTGGVLKDNGEYVFAKDSNITIKGGDSAIIHGSADKDLIIKADKNNTLNLVVEDDQFWAHGVNNAYGKGEINVNKLNVEVFNKSKDGKAIGLYNGDRGADLVVNGDVGVKSKGEDVYGIWTYSGTVTVNGNMNIELDGDARTGIYAGPRGTVTINGDYNQEETGTAIDAAGEDATINLNGNVNIGRAEGYTLIARGKSNINVNVKADKDGNISAANNVVKMVGDISVEPTRTNPGGTINLGLSNKDSVWKGAIYFGHSGKANIYLSNGAHWYNQVYGRWSSGVSVVENFVGGADLKHAGYIMQTAGSNLLALKNYSGAAIIVYDHENAGADVDDYRGGDTRIIQAAEGSVVRLVTDNTNIDMENKDVVEAAMSALAKKIGYVDARGDDQEALDALKRLKGEVSIADGLTSSSKSMVGDLSFAEWGEGKYVPGSMREDDASGGDDDIITGDYETDIMKGARSAMMTSMLAWRDNAAEIYSRAADLCDGAEAGVWARTYGGKAKFDGNTSIDNSYWAGQVGYDKTTESGWSVGAAIDYVDGNASYLNAGKGDNSLYSLGLYGSKALGGSQYLDLTAKVGRVENEYNVYNLIGKELKGDFKSTGYSLSAQYSRRFGDGKGYFEPQLQFTYAHVDGDDYNAYAGEQMLNINQKAFDSFVGRVGVKAGIADEKGGLYARLSLAHEFAGDVEGSYTAADGGTKTTKYDLGGTWSELTLGGSYNLSKCSSFYADVTRSLSGDYQHQWKLNAGLSFTF